MRKVLLGGFVMGALAAGVFHQGTAFLFWHFLNGVPAVTGVFGRMNGPGWDLARLLPGLGAPQFLGQMLWGGVWGIPIAAAIRWLPLPDFPLALLLGALLPTFVGAAQATALLGPPFAIGTPDQMLLQALLLNGAFGYGCAVLMRPLEMRRGGALAMRHAWAPK